MSDQPSLTADNWYTTGPDLKCLITLREQTGRWPLGHPNEDVEVECDACLAAGVCRCGNRFDGDNLCMLSACEQEE